MAINWETTCTHCGKGIKQIGEFNKLIWVHISSYWKNCHAVGSTVAEPSGYVRPDGYALKANEYFSNGTIRNIEDAVETVMDVHGNLHDDPLAKMDSTNPKDLLGAKKVSLSAVPPVAILHESMAMMDGEWKYGFRNYREKKVQARIYIDAALRHINAWAEGEEIADDSNVHHLGHARACLGILLDALESGNLIDNRVQGVYPKVAKRMEEWVAERKKKYENKPIPKSAATIGDAVKPTTDPLGGAFIRNKTCRSSDRNG